jgi:hypothetical protein
MCISFPPLRELSFAEIRYSNKLLTLLLNLHLHQKFLHLYDFYSKKGILYSDSLKVQNLILPQKILFLQKRIESLEADNIDFNDCKIHTFNYFTNHILKDFQNFLSDDFYIFNDFFLSSDFHLFNDFYFKISSEEVQELTSIILNSKLYDYHEEQTMDNNIQFLLFQEMNFQFILKLRKDFVTNQKILEKDNTAKFHYFQILDRRLFYSMETIDRYSSKHDFYNQSKKNHYELKAWFFKKFLTSREKI